MNNENLIFAGRPVILSYILTVDVQYTSTRERTWKERFFSLPWEPWRVLETKIEIRQEPNPSIYQLEGKFFMHPETFRKLTEKLSDENNF